MADPDSLRVEVYSGHTYAQEPRAFTWQGQRHVITQVSDRWRTPHGPAFCVETEKAKEFKLCYDESLDRWSFL